LRTERRSNVSLNKNKILDSVAASQPEGRHVKGIMDDTLLSRATVARLCNELEREGYITKKNKQAPYRLTEKPIGDPSNKAFLFQNNAVRNLQKLVWMSDQSRFLNMKRYKDILRDSKHIDGNPTLDQLLLFEFANKIAALILYTLIEVVRPYKIVNKIRKERIKIKGRDRDNIAKTWIKSINPSRLFHEFSKIDIVNRGRAIHTLSMDPHKMFPIRWSGDELDLKRRFSRELMESLNREERQQFEENPDLKKDVHRWVEGTVSNIRLMAPQDPNWSFYEMDEKNYSYLVDCYKSIYPEAYEYLENIKNNLDTEIETLRKISLEHIRKWKMDPDHTKCDGKLLPQIKFNTKGKKVKQCPKCQRWVRV
jgi:hypothetical protein